MCRIRDHQSRLWRVELKEASKKKYNPVCNHAHETSNLKDFINYLHATAFSIWPSDIDLDKGHQIWEFYILARTNITSS
jgi:hypothetical protein